MRFNIILAVLLVLMTFSFAQSVDNTITRPWDNAFWVADNPYLVPCESHVITAARLFGFTGTVYYYYPEMDSSLDQLGLDDTEQLFLETGLESDINVSSDVKEKVEEAQQSREGAAQMRAGMNSIDLFYLILSGEPHTCVEAAGYADAWKETIDLSLYALELSIEDVSYYTGMAREEEEKLQHTGICDDDYVWPPKEACDELSSAVLTMDSGALEGTYGKANIMYNYTYALNDGMKENVPNTTLYYPMMELVWAEDGIIATYSGIIEEGEAAKEDAEGIYGQYKREADTAKDYAEERYGEIESNKLDKIDVPVALAVVDESRIGTIEERYEAVSEEKRNADRAYDNAEDTFTNTWLEGYLKYATINMSYAKESYESLEDKMDLLLEDAEQVVDDAKEEAEQKIDDAKLRYSSMGTSGQARLEEAEGYLEKGDSASAFGDKYGYYLEAAASAAAAMGEKSSVEEADIQLKISEINDLLGRAEDDGINIASEEAELKMLEKNEDLPDISYRLDSLKSRIIGKAETVFGGLELQREELLRKLRTAGASDLIDEMRDAENGIVVGGRIDYENGLGKLSWLESQYESIEEQLEEDLEAMNDLVANSMVTDTSLIIGKVKIDKPTNLSLNILFMNTDAYEGEDVEVTVQVPGKFQFDYFDISDGADEVSGLTIQSTKLKITLKSVEAYETKSVTFEKSQILARTLSEEQSAVGLGDGSASIEKSTVFDLDVEDVYIDVPENSATDVTIDGLGVDRPLSKGVHTLERSYILDAYNEGRSEAVVSSTGLETTVSYVITITPYIALDSVPVVVDVGESEQLTDVSISCVEYDYDVAGTRIDIFNLAADSPATVQVEYSISDLDSYVADELDRLSGMTEPGIVSLVGDAQAFYSAGDYEAALEKIEEIRKKSAELDKDKSKLVRKYSELVRDINRELDDLDAAIGKAGELNVSSSTLMDKFISRRTELSAVLASMENISSTSSCSDLQNAVDELEKIDGNWLKKQITSYKKDATKQLNDYRNDFVGFGDSDANELLETLEHDINVLAATEKAGSAVVVMADLEALESMLDGLEGEQRIRTEELRLDFELLKEKTESILSSYSSESKSAKGTSFADMFSVSESSVTKLISDIEKSIGVRSFDYIENKMKELEKKKDAMEDVLEELRSQAEGKLRSIKSVYSENSQSLSEDDRSFISGEILEMEELISAGRYANAMARGDSIIESINSSQEGDNFLFLLLASLLVLAMIIIYMIRQQKPKKPKIKLEKEGTPEV